MTTDKNNSCHLGATAPGFKIAARFARRERRCCFYKLFRLFPKELIGKTEGRECVILSFVKGKKCEIIPFLEEVLMTKDEIKAFLELNRRRKGTETIAYYQDRGECDFVVCEDETVRQLVQVTWNMSATDERSRTTRKREINGLVDAAEALGCENLTIVTHDEETTIESQGHDIRVIPAWKWLMDGSDHL